MPKKRGADLRVRAALLAWDGRGDAQKALALRREGRSSAGAGDPAGRGARVERRRRCCTRASPSEEARRQGRAGRARRAPVVARARRGAGGRAARAAGDEGRVARRLALALAGELGAAGRGASVAGETAEADLDALAEAAPTAQDRLGDPTRRARAAGARLRRGADEARRAQLALSDRAAARARRRRTRPTSIAPSCRRSATSRAPAPSARRRSTCSRARSSAPGGEAKRPSSSPQLTAAATGGATTSARCWPGARARGWRRSAASGRARPRRGSSWRAWPASPAGRTRICGAPPSCGTRASATGARRGALRAAARGHRPTRRWRCALARLRILRGAAVEAAQVLETHARARAGAGGRDAAGGAGGARAERRCDGECGARPR